MFLRDFIRRILGMKPLAPGAHELDFTEHTAKLKQPETAPAEQVNVEAKPKKPRKPKVAK